MNKEFHYICIDEGQPDDKNPCFVWLHGWGQNHTAMHRLAQLFKKTGKHYLFDLPGFGESPAPAEGAGTKDYADMLAKELQKTGEGPFVFIGHSFGARVSVQMAAHYPKMVESIILIAGAGLPRKRSFSYKIRAAFLRWLGKCARLSDKILHTNLRNAYSARFGSADYKAAGALRPTFVRVVNEDLSKEATILTCPTLLIYGSDDTETPPDMGKKYQGLIRHASYQELAGFGHLDILDRGAYQCQALITDFLANQQP